MNNTNPTEQEPAPGLVRRIVFGRNPHWTLLRVILWTVLLILGSRFVVLPVKVHGVSMLPTYHDNQINLINKLVYRKHGPARGDVVAIRYAGEHMMLLKRVIGLPGETVAFRGGKVFINGEMLSEPYIKLPTNWNRLPVTLEPDEYFVVGDNRSMPAEDHTFGRAKRYRIVGKAML